MSFCSFEFVVFLPVIFLLYWFVCRSWKQQNFLIVIASYIFYGWWDWRFLLLIALTSLCSYGSGLLLNHYEGHRKQQQIVSASNIILNLGILGVFKYYNFFVENLDVLAKAIGWKFDWVAINFILPVGISFYTFQALSYTIDVYQGKIKPTKDIVRFFAYISFFPQLVAGPIERSTNLLPQFGSRRTFDYALAVDGCRQMLWGFLKKLVVADYCAMIVELNWFQYQNYSGITLFFLAVLFTFQIYCDFSGYSDIAIGCSKLFGIRLMKNFDLPYFSRNISEFWRRWHISLMTWFRDYVYIPLGGSKCSRLRVITNVLIVFLISGLWHGASWNFVAWGGYNGALVAGASLVGCNLRYKSVVAEGMRLPSVKEVLSMIVTFVFVVIGWIIFRSGTIEQTVGFISRLFILDTASIRIIGRLPLFYCVLLLLIEWIQRSKEHPLQFSSNLLNNHAFLRYAIYIIIFVIIFRFSGQVQTFIYFQF